MVIVSITPEIALEKSRIYAGGLGVLEGDKFYAAGDMGLDYLVLTLYYRHGYTRIEYHGDRIILNEESQDLEFLNDLRPEPEFTIKLKNTNVYVRPWVYRYKTAKAILFEATCPEWARRLTSRVYVEDTDEDKYLKYILLAKSSAEYLIKNIGVENIALLDLEESYTALVLYLLDINQRTRIILHTPGPWGHPIFPSEILERELGIRSSVPLVNMTQEAIRRLGRVIVVSQKQRDIIPRIFPEVRSKLKAITNGIYLERWMDPVLLKAWFTNDLKLELLKERREISKKKIENLICKYKPGVKLGDKMVITWARRLSRYKRPYFIARFIEEYPDLDVIYVLAGKPHPKDPDGLNYLSRIRDLSLKLSNVIYIKDYDVEIAKTLTRGSDLWVFTPFSGWEACGTSYMKALINGVPVLSSRDGGVLEIVEDNVNGWLFGADNRDFINIYEDPRAREIDENEYKEFSNKLKEIIDIYYRRSEKYWEVSFNAWKITPQRVDIKKVLREYYLMD